MHVTPLSTGKTEAQTEVPRPTDAQVTVPAATGKKPSGGKGLKVAVIVLAVAVVAMGIGLGGILTNWYGLGGGGVSIEEANPGGNPASASEEHPPRQTMPAGEVHAVAVVELPTGERGKRSYDDLGNSILYESTASDGLPFSTTSTSYGVDGNPMHETMIFAEKYAGSYTDTDTTYDYEFDDRGRAIVSYAKASGSAKVIGKTYLSYHSDADGTFREIKSCQVMRISISGSSDTYRYVERTRVMDERGLPLSYVVTAWPSSTEPLDVVKYEADIRAGLAPEGSILEEQHYEWSYDGWKPTSVTVQRHENQLEYYDSETSDTVVTYEVDADEYGDVTGIRIKDGNPILRLEYTTIRSDTSDTVARARDTMSDAIVFSLRNA